jgi:hypothetical protein
MGTASESGLGSGSGSERGRVRERTVEEHLEAVCVVAARARRLPSRALMEPPESTAGFVDEGFGLLVRCVRWLDDQAAPWAVVAQMERLRGALYGLRSAGVLLDRELCGYEGEGASAEIARWRWLRMRIYSLAVREAAALEVLMDGRGAGRVGRLGWRGAARLL